MKLNNLKIHNFCSFENSSIEFTDDLFYLILGSNLDSETADSNGSGKTSLVEAISYLLFKKVLKDNSEIQRKETSYGYIEGNFTHKNQQLTICREFGTKKSSDRPVLANDSKFGSNSLFLYLDGQELTKKTNKETQLKLFDILGIKEDFAFDLFCNTTYLSSSAANSFILGNLGPSEQFKFISKFLETDRFDVGLDNAKKHLKELTDENTKIYNDSDSKEEELSSIGELEDISIVDSKIKDCDKKIADLNTKKSVFDSYYSNTKLLESKKRELDKLNIAKEAELSNIKDKASVVKQKLVNAIDARDNISALKEKIVALDGKQEAQGALLKDLESYQGQLATLNTECDNLINKTYYTCPSCSTTLFLLNNSLQLSESMDIIDKRVEELKESIGKFNSEKLRIHGELENISKDIREYDSLKAKHEDYITLIDSAESIVAELEGFKDTIKDKEATYNAEIKSLDVEIQKLSDSLASYDIDELRSIESDLKKFIADRDDHQKWLGELAGLKKRKVTLIASIAELKKKGDGLKDKIGSCQFWVDGFPAMKRWVINGFLPKISSLINSNLSLGFQVSLSTTKELKSREGEKVQFNIEVFDGKVTRDLKTFSSGERSRISLASALAFREVLGEMFNNPFEWVMIDEIFDSLDISGIREFEVIFSDMVGQKFVISHNDYVKDSMDVDNVLLVTKRDGISNVEIL